jgi:hypothetical protein
LTLAYFNQAFVASTTITSFNSDLMDFFNYLAANNGFPKSQYLVVLEAGTEPFIGTSVTFNTDQYSVAVNVGTTQTGWSRLSVMNYLSLSLVYGRCGGIGWTGPTVSFQASSDQVGTEISFAGLRVWVYMHLLQSYVSLVPNVGPIIDI